MIPRSYQDSTNCEHVSRRAATPERSRSWHTRGLHFGRMSGVGRIVFKAHLLANEDYYERRIYTLCEVGIQKVKKEYMCCTSTHRDKHDQGEAWTREVINNHRDRI